MSYETQYAAYQQGIEDYLAGLFTAETPYKKLYEAIRYSLLAGGKRIRPVLTLEFARLGGIDWHLALPYGCALELVHNYSLIHDDLPCMDNDDLRRGKPTNHKVYGETLAVLAGDAMQPEAFRLMAEAPCLPAENRLEAVRTLARACGADGMVGGQVLDTVYDVRDAAGLTVLNRLKTGVMISAAAELGCIASEMPATMRAQALVYADAIGRGFQIRDDMLDVEGEPGRVRQAYRFRCSGGQGHIRRCYWHGRLPPGGGRLHRDGQGSGGRMAGPWFPLGVGGPNGGPQEVSNKRIPAPRCGYSFIALFRSRTTTVKGIRCIEDHGPCTGRGRGAPCGGRSCWTPLAG